MLCGDLLMLQPESLLELHRPSLERFPHPQWREAIFFGLNYDIISSALHTLQPCTPYMKSLIEQDVRL